MAEEFLYGSDVVAVFQQVGCEAVPQGVHRCLLGDPRSKQRLLERLLKGRGMDVVAADSMGAGIHRKRLGREKPEPCSLLAGVGVFPVQSAGHVDPV